MKHYEVGDLVVSADHETVHRIAAHSSGSSLVPDGWPISEKGAALNPKFIRPYKGALSAIPDNRCKCSMSISMLGDGCRYCQPQEYIDRLHEQLEDYENESQEGFAL